MKKHYGIHRTHLQLTEKAEAYYNNTDPLDIWEWDTANGYRYTMTGADEIDDLVTESFLNDYLESLADAVAEAEAEEADNGTE